MSKKQIKQAKGSLSNPAQTWYHQGLHAFKRGAYDQSILLWQKVVSDSSYRLNPALENALTEAYFRAGQKLAATDTTTALDYLSKASKRQPTDALHAYHVGLQYHRQNELEQAIEWYQTALALDSQFNRAAYSLALALAYRSKDPAEHPAWALLTPAQRARLTHSDDHEALSTAFHYLEQDQWTLAEPLIAQVAQDTSATTPIGVRRLAVYYQGVIQQRQGDRAGAITSWRHAAELGLDTPPLQRNLSAGYLPAIEQAVRAEKWEAARLEVERALLASPANKRLRDLFDHIQLQQGYQAAMQGQWATALKSWQAINGVSGANARNLSINRAIAYEKLEIYEQAAAAWRDFVRRRTRSEDSDNWLSPVQVARLWSRISSLYQKAGQPDEVSATLLTALKYEPEAADLHLQLANAYAVDERFEAAHNAVDRALALDPRHISALVLRAELTEFHPRASSWRREMEVEPGIREWKAVLAVNDDAYTAIAREHLEKLYFTQIDRFAFFGMEAEIGNTFREALDVLPSDSILRAEYIEHLLVEQSDPDAAEQQIALLDPTNTEALVIVAAAWIAVKSPGQASILIQKADAHQRLSAEFYVELGGAVLKVHQPDEAARFFAEALRRTGNDPMDRLDVQLDITAQYLDSAQYAIGLSQIDQILTEYKSFGPALILRAMYWAKKQDRTAALKDINEAEKWARTNNLSDLLAHIRQLKALINSPFGGMFGNPFSLPFGRNGSPSGDFVPVFGEHDGMEADEDMADEADELPSPILLPRRGKRSPNKPG